MANDSEIGALAAYTSRRCAAFNSDGRVRQSGGF